MAEQITKKKPRTLWQNFLILLVVIFAVVIILILFAKTKVTFSPQLLFAIVTIAIIAVFIFIFFTKKKVRDAYHVIRLVKNKAYMNDAITLDDSGDNVRIKPITDSLYAVEFFKEHLVYHYDSRIDDVVGKEVSTLNRVKQEYEKSKFAQQVALQPSKMKELQDAASSLGIDPKSIGIEGE